MNAPCGPRGRARSPGRPRSPRDRRALPRTLRTIALAALVATAPLSCTWATAPGVAPPAGPSPLADPVTDAPRSSVATTGVVVAPAASAPGATPRLTAAGGWLFPGVDDVAEPAPELVGALHAAANQARAAHGAPAAAWDEGLARAARQHAAELAARNVLDHLGLDPARRTVADRLARAGSPYTTHAENLAAVPAGLDRVHATIDGWLHSPGHRENLLRPDFDRMGFGTATGANGTVFVTQVLARAPWVPSAWSVRLLELDTVRLTLGLEVAAPTTVLIDVDGAQSRQRLDAGARSWTLELAQPGPWEVAVAVPASASGRFTIEDAGRVADDGRWLPHEGRVLPREVVRVASVAVAPHAREVVRLRLALPTPEAQLVVGALQVPSAHRGGGLIEAELDLADGGELVLGLAEPAGDGRWAVRHRWVLRRDGAAVDWAARP